MFSVMEKTLKYTQTDEFEWEIGLVIVIFGK